MKNLLLISSKKRCKLPSLLFCFTLIIVFFTQCSEKNGTAKEISCGDKIIPSWSKTAFYFNADTLTGSPIIDIIKEKKVVSKKIDSIASKVNIDPYKDISCISGGVSTSNIGTKDVDFIVFIKVKYDADKLVKVIKEKYKVSLEEKIKGYKVISVSSARNKVKVAFIEEKYILITSLLKINEGLDLIRKNRIKPLDNNKLDSAIKNVNNNNLLWVALESPPLPMLTKDIKPDIITISSSIDANLSLSVKGFSKSEESAKNLITQLQGMLALGKVTLAKVIPVDIIDKIKIEREGNIVNTSIKLTTKDIKRLTEKRIKK